ncbi:MAG TPA: glycosyltransferase family 87 protein [Alphaproteobacteria bacterium]|nr:glycosyltransferase family 87 protein [Alphaproteobacteria bacterium]
MLFGLVYLSAGLASAWRLDGPGLINSGLPLGRDFVAFWSASALALDGSPEAVFDLKRIHDYQIAVAGAPINVTAWHYPPTFLLAILPLAYLPYVAALAVFLLVPLIAFWLIIRRLYGSTLLATLMLLFPGLTLCVVSGQNGIITAALLGGGLLALESRPTVAGILFGLLTFKPHLAALIFPALMFGRYWHALGASVATSITIILASLAVLGTPVWGAFFTNLEFLTGLLDSGALPWIRMPTVYSATRVMGFDATAGRLFQIAAAVAAVTFVCAIWHRRAPLAWRGSALALALPLATPYAFDYDLVVLTLPFAWLLLQEMSEASRPANDLLLAAAWAAPALFWVISLAGGPPLMPLLLAALMLLVWRHVFAGAAPPLQHSIGKAA